MHNYIITCTVNGKIYVGCTVKSNLKRYFRQKMSDATTRSKARKIPLYNAFRKYGVDSFVCESMYRPSSKEEMFAMEKAMIEHLDSRNRHIGYNVTAGGIGAIGVKKTVKEKKRMSEFMQGKQFALGLKRSQEQRVGMRERMIGNKYGLGRKPSEKQMTALMENSFVNMSPEEFKRIREKATASRIANAKPLTEEHKQKLSAATKGKPKSEETKQRMRDACARRTPEYKTALSVLANQKRQEKLSPEQRSAIAKIASDAALAKKKSA